MALDAADLYFEGGAKMRPHLLIERNPTLRRDSKAYWRDRMGGKLRCWVWNFDFARKYGEELGGQVIEMHHEEQLSQDVARRPKRVTDLLPVCSNCHRIIHRFPKRGLNAAALKRQLARMT